MPTKAALMPLYKASVKDLAEVGGSNTGTFAADVDGAIIERIKKCLQRAEHRNTASQEAKAAFFYAAKIMSQYNVTHADLLAHASPEARQDHAGQSSVEIKRSDASGKAVNKQGFVGDLAGAMEVFFDCKCYSQGGFTDRINWVFYGIAQNTVAAAMAFESAYNLIAEWALQHKGIGTRNSYCMGVAEELQRMADDEKKEELQQAKEAETKAIKERAEAEMKQRQAELDRLQPLPAARVASPAPEIKAEPFGFPSHPISPLNEGLIEDDSDDVGVNFDDGDETGDHLLAAEPDFGAEDEAKINVNDDDDLNIAKLIKSEPVDYDSDIEALERLPGPITSPYFRKSVNNRSLKPESADSNDDASQTVSNWKSIMQLTLFRENATKIADDYLKESGRKLSHRKRKRCEVRDSEAYKQGMLDSKKIDVHRKRIKAAEGDGADTDDTF